MQLTPLKLALCGPRDVSKEILIAKDAAQKWNQLHSEARAECRSGRCEEIQSDA